MKKGIIRTLVLAAVLLATVILAGVSLQSQNQSINPFLYQTLFPYVSIHADQSTLEKVTTWSDKTVIGVESYSNMEIILNGNLIVENGGSLTLTNVTLKVNCTANGSSRIVVNSGGALYINDGDGNPNTRNDASKITSYNPHYRFLFWVQSGATFQMRNSELHYCGYGYRTNELDFCGLRIAANDTVVENNILTNNYVGIILPSAYNNTIRNNTATNNDYSGFYLVAASNASIVGNTAADNYVGFYFWGGTLNNFLGNTATKNTFGFVLLVTHRNNFANNTAEENTHGFYLESCYWNSLTGNTATDNDCYGFFLNDSWYNSLINNTATDNLYGFYLCYSYTNKITCNKAEGNTYGFLLAHDSNNNNLTGNFATENYYGFYLSRDSRNNYLANNTATGNTYDYLFEKSESKYGEVFFLLLYLAFQDLLTPDQMLVVMFVLVGVFILYIFCPLVSSIAEGKFTALGGLIIFTLLLTIFGGVFCFALTRGYHYVDPAGFKACVACLAYLLGTQPAAWQVPLFLNALFSIGDYALSVFLYYLGDILLFKEYIWVLIGYTPYLINYAGMVEGVRLFFLGILGFLTLGFLGYLGLFLHTRTIRREHISIRYPTWGETSKKKPKESRSAPKRVRKYKFNEYGEIVEEDEDEF